MDLEYEFYHGGPKKEGVRGIAVNLRSLKKILQGGSIKTNVLEYRSSVRS